MSKITTLFSCGVEKPSVIYFCCTCQGRRERCVLVQDNGGWPWPFEGSVCHKYLWAGPDMTQPDRFTRLSSTAVHSVCKPCRDFQRGRHHQRIKSWNSQSGQSVYSYSYSFYKGDEFHWATIVQLYKRRARMSPCSLLVSHGMHYIWNAC